jgi:nucleotide-binding universal stress UspA family protein
MAIVCGADFSASGAAAVRAAAALAARLGQPLWLVHVVDGSIQRLDSRAKDLLLSAAATRLQEEAQRLRACVRRRLHTKVLVGSPSEALVSFPEVRNPTLVVVSSQGHGSSPLYRLGGTSERIAATSPVPVLVAREAEPFEAWSRRARPLRVVLGVDFAAGGEAAIEWVKALRRAAPCDVTVAHLYYADEAHRRYGLHAQSLISVNPGLEELLRRDLARRVGRMPGSGKIAFRPALAMGRLADHLLDLAERVRADLVVVGTHHHRGVARLASVANGVLHMGRMAVAVVPNTAANAARKDSLPAIRHVLIATDFSDAANAAVAHGYGLLAATGGEVHLLHVVAGARGRRHAEREAALAARLRGLRPETAVHRELVTHVEIAYGSVARTICDVAEHLGVDVICMGSHGRAGAVTALLGSVAAAVLRESRRPVLIMRPPR